MHHFTSNQLHGDVARKKKCRKLVICWFISGADGASVPEVTMATGVCFACSEMSQGASEDMRVNLGHK